MKQVTFHQVPKLTQAEQDAFAKKNPAQAARIAKQVAAWKKQYPDLF